MIDTSTNYELGESETMIGNVLQGMIEQQIIAREEVVVMSKIGYMQGNNLELAREREAQGTPFAQVVCCLYASCNLQSKCHHFHWHCIAPDFLQEQLTSSLERLNLQTLDVLFLHNPEYCWTQEVLSNIQDDDANY